jgi:hypothetical protein
MDHPEAGVADVFYTALLQHIGCVAYAHETALVFGDERVMHGAVPRTNFADARDVFVTFLPAVTRGRTPLAYAGIVAFLLTRGEALGPARHRGDLRCRTDGSPYRLSHGVATRPQPHRRVLERHGWASAAPQVRAAAASEADAVTHRPQARSVTLRLSGSSV